MKNLLKPIERTSATFVTKEDGVVSIATEHLNAIKYPNRLNDIAVIGKKKDWQRSFLLRPKYGGVFLFILYPKDNINNETVIMKEFTCPSFNSAPVLLEIDIPIYLREYLHWNYKVVKIAIANEQEHNYSELDLQEISDGTLSVDTSVSLANYAKEEFLYTTLIYDMKGVIEGNISFNEEKESEKSKLCIWSCHQPYVGVNGKAQVKESSEHILPWYEKIINDFSPHMIWMLGDSSYSDGISALDFVNQVYDKKGWQNSWAMKKDLLSLYRLNYRYHWSFSSMQNIMRNYPHLGMWDDHEIRDGYGSDENDFKYENIAIKDIASQAAQEYLFQISPKLRSESNTNIAIDNHQIVFNNSIASFVFDGRNSRNYGEDLAIPSEIPILAGHIAGLFIGGIAGSIVSNLSDTLTEEIIDLYRWNNPAEVISDAQLKDFENFCNTLKAQTHTKYLLLGNSVPFIYLMDFIETIASESAIAGSDLGKNIRDDLRDGWHSPANRRQLAKLIDILRNLHHAREDIEFINISGDIHISNAFTFQPEGFSKPLFQVTSSAITNDPPSGSEGGILELLSVDGLLSFNAKSKDLGNITRLWHAAEKQNFLTVEADLNEIKLHLHVFELEDKVLTIKSNEGFELKE